MRQDDTDRSQAHIHQADVHGICPGWNDAGCGKGLRAAAGPQAGQEVLKGKKHDFLRSCRTE
jgi:hypothetical protein